MLGFPNQGHKKYEGFKPMNAAGEIEYPKPRAPERLNLVQDADDRWIFLDAEHDSILWFASFYTGNGARRVYDYLAKGGLLDAKV